MKKHKLLFLDDEDNVLRSLERLFQDTEYEVYTINNSKEAIKLLDKHKFSLIISDYRMPEMDGVEFLKIAKEKSSETIRMILTGFADVDVAISAINEGEIYKFIEKPWDGEQLKVQLKQALEFYEVVEERKELLDKVKEQNEELKEWNVNLEKKVEEKTEELMRAYKKLQLKVKELEGRDRILQSLLTINDFEDTLDLVIEAILNIVKFDDIIIYVVDKEQKKMIAKSGYSRDNSKSIKMGNKISNFPSVPIPALNPDKEQSDYDEYQMDKINEYSYLIPIWKEGNCLGAILIDNSKSSRIIEQEEFNIVAGFASLAALAINDYLVTYSLPDIEDRINEMLGE